MQSSAVATRASTIGLVAVVLAVVGPASVGRARGQEARLEPPVPGLPPLPAASEAPASPVPVAAPPEVAADPSKAALEARLLQLESMVRQLSTQLQSMQQPQVPAASGIESPLGPAPPGSAALMGEETGNFPGAATPAAPPGTPPPSPPGQSFPPTPPTAGFDSPPPLADLKVKSRFGPGFEFRTEDDEFILQFHNLTQVDYRGYEQGGQTPVHDTFGIPRQWFMFSGRMTRPIGYFVSLAHGFDTITLLDVFLDVTYNQALNFRFGRTKTPFTYEFMSDPVQGLLLPERSVFFNNFGQNRDIGVMGFGRLLDQRFDYMVGVWNGSRNGVLSPHDGKFVSSLINMRPFLKREDSPFQYLNIGGSVYAGSAFNSPTVPTVFRTVVPTGGNAIVGIPFLTLNNNIRETGYQAFWDLHMAWYYKQLALLAEWGSGFQGYSPANATNQRTYLPVGSFYVLAGYLLTGETRNNLGVVKPKQPFSLKAGQFGIGAWELVSRFQYLDIGSEVFTNGLSDPNDWANRLDLVDVGLNWYPNQYLKIMLDWEHGWYNNPILFAPGRRQATSDQLILRMQLYF